MGKFVETPIPRTRTCVEDAAPQKPLPHLRTARLRSRPGIPSKKGKKGGLSETERKLKGNHRRVNWKGLGGGAKTCRKIENPKNRPRRGGARLNFTTENDKNHMVLCHSRPGKIT